MVTELSMGIAMTSDPERSRQRLGDLCKALERATGFRVGLQGPFPYHNLLASLENGGLDLAWLPPLLALRSTGRGIVTPLALPVRHGVSTYSTALFTRPDSAISGLDALEGVKAAWVDPQSASGYRVIRALLRSRGIDLDKAFARNSFLGSHDAVVGAVLRGEADVGATFVYLDSDAVPGRQPPKAAGWNDQSVRILSVAGSIPSDMIAARAQLDPEIIRVLRHALVSGEHPDVVQAANVLLAAEGFVLPSPDHLAALTTVLSGLEDESPSRRTPGGSSRPGT